MTTQDPYSFGNPESEPEQDKRAEYRLTGRAGVTLELVAAELGSGTEANIIQAASSDVSAGGMRLVTEEPLPQGALLPARVLLPGEEQGFELTVEVVWCRPMATDGQWQSGLCVLESGEANYLAWIEAMARVMEAG